MSLSATFGTLAARSAAAALAAGGIGRPAGAAAACLWPAAKMLNAHFSSSRVVASQQAPGMQRRAVATAAPPRTAAQISRPPPSAAALLAARPPAGCLLPLAATPVLPRAPPACHLDAYILDMQSALPAPTDAAGGSGTSLRAVVSAGLRAAIQRKWFANYELDEHKRAAFEALMLVLPFAQHVLDVKAGVRSVHVCSTCLNGAAGDRVPMTVPREWRGVSGGAGGVQRGDLITTKKYSGTNELLRRLMCAVCDRKLWVRAAFAPVRAPNPLAALHSLHRSHSY